MQQIAKIEDYDNYYRVLSMEFLDKRHLMMAKEIFEEYKKSGVITGGSFSDDTWTMNNELLSKKLRFDITEEEYKSGAGKWIGVTRKQYQNLMKTYLCLTFGEVELGHLVYISAQLRLLVTIEAEACIDTLQESAHVIAFLKLLPGESPRRDRVIEDMEDHNQSRKWKKTASRKLSDFRTYLVFDREIQHFWDSADEKKRLRYFPVYFWWKVTAVLPLRATEFLLTPYDCIHENKNGYQLTIRRTRLKKKGSVTYKIETDYEEHVYSISDELAELIIRYKEKSGHEDRKTLLLSSGNTWYMTYGQLATRLKCFLKDEIIRPDLAVHVGDTRHIAMINLILSGGSPTVCKELAGHESIDISSNYYANLSSIIESSVYDYCTRMEQGAEICGTIPFSLDLPQERIRLKTGWCSYPPVADGDISECIKNYTHGNSLGDCRLCLHFIPDQRGISLKITRERKKAVDDSCEYLIQVIEMVRRGNGAEEDIMSAMARLHNDSYRYANTLMIIGKGDRKNGTPKEK